MVLIINNCENICTVCERPFKHKRRGFRLLGDELKTVFFITCHSKCCKHLKYESLKKLIYTFFLEKRVRVVDLESS